ncbi:hypothetical protein Ac2012v2_004474 [Leucoagaricus gongylophorus]
MCWTIERPTEKCCRQVDSSSSLAVHLQQVSPSLFEFKTYVLISRVRPTSIYPSLGYDTSCKEILNRGTVCYSHSLVSSAFSFFINLCPPFCRRILLPPVKSGTDRLDDLFVSYGVTCILINLT